MTQSGGVEGVWEAQMEEQFLAKKVAALTGAQVNNLPNPRNEAVENAQGISKKHSFQTKCLLI